MGGVDEDRGAGRAEVEERTFVSGSSRRCGVCSLLLFLLPGRSSLFFPAGLHSSSFIVFRTPRSKRGVVELSLLKKGLRFSNASHSCSCRPDLSQPFLASLSERQAGEAKRETICALRPCLGLTNFAARSILVPPPSSSTTTMPPLSRPLKALSATTRTLATAAATKPYVPSCRRPIRSKANDRPQSHRFVRLSSSKGDSTNELCCFPYSSPPPAIANATRIDSIAKHPPMRSFEQLSC